MEINHREEILRKKVEGRRLYKEATFELPGDLGRGQRLDF